MHFLIMLVIQVIGAVVVALKLFTNVDITQSRNTKNTVRVEIGCIIQRSCLIQLKLLERFPPYFHNVFFTAHCCIMTPA